MGIRRRAIGGKGRRRELKLENHLQAKKNRELRIKSGVTLARAMTVLYAVKTIAGLVSIFSLF